MLVFYTSFYSLLLTYFSYFCFKIYCYGSLDQENINQKAVILVQVEVGNSWFMSMSKTGFFLGIWKHVGL